MLGIGTTKAAAPIAHRCHLFHDLVLKVPRQNEHIIRPALQYPLGRVNGNLHPGQIAPLLVRTAIDGEADQFRPHAAVIQQRAALRRRAVTGNQLSLASRGDEELQHLALHVDHPVGEPVVDRQLRQPGCQFLRQHIMQPRSVPSRTIPRVTGMDAQRTAMRRQTIDVEYRQAMTREHLVDHQQRKIRKVLMIDRVELAFRDQPQQVRKLDRDECRQASAATRAPRRSR